MSISAVITTKNEEENISRCIRSLHFADEIIVVDDFSEDDTIAIAKRHGARVVQHKWAGYGPQKNIGLSHATRQWVLFVDADEEISSELANEIREVVTRAKFDVYWLRVLDIFLGRPLHHLTGNNPRLVRRGAAQWTLRPVHEQVTLVDHGIVVRLHDPHSDILKSFLIHHSYNSIASYLRKMHRYTTLDARHMAATNQHRSGRTVRQNAFLPYILAARQLTKLAFWRRGVLDGYPGLVWCVLSAYYEWEMGKKFLRIKARG